MSNKEIPISTDLSIHFDPYEKFLREEKHKTNLIHQGNSSKLARKFLKLKNWANAAKNNAKQGAMMGFMVGGLFGGAVGLYSAFQTKRFLAIPISIIVSGTSFGFILGCGSLVRSYERSSL